MKRYVLGFAFNKKMDKVLMIHKESGPYPGKWNGLGGNIEESEGTDYAMVREFTEESQIHIRKILKMRMMFILQYPDIELCVYYLILNHNDPSYCYLHKEGLVEWLDVDYKLLNLDNGDLAENVQFFIRNALRSEKKI